MSWITSIVVFLHLVTHISGRGADLTLQRDAMGADVVRAVLSKMDTFNESSTTLAERQIYEQFIRESAYVESMDGANYPLDDREGGIWKISRDIFEQTQQYDYPEFFSEICSVFCIDWSSVHYSDLRIPLYSGLAMRLYLFHLRITGLGLEGYALDEDRATFWVSNFGGQRSISIWITRVYKLRNVEVCRVEADVMFVIDSSGSIGANNYQTVREYTYNFTKGLLSGNTSSRVGLIVFSDTAAVDIDLDFVNSNEETALLEEIRNLRYTGGFTNTPEALCLLKTVQWRESVSVLRTAVVLTDGQANQLSTNCSDSNGGPGTVNSTAEEVHNLDPPVTVYAVGVASYVIAELNTIATKPDLVDTLASFDYRLLLQNQHSRTYFICYKKSQPVTTGEEQNGTISMGSVSRLEFSGPADEGVTIRICIERGVIVVYGSYTISNPSAALHDFSIELRAVAGGVKRSNCLTSHTTLDDLNGSSNKDTCTLCEATNQRNKRQAEEEETVTVYVTIEGTSESESQFSVNSSLGSAFECATDFCGENAVLVRTDGSCSCRCMQGYQGDGQDCSKCPTCGENAVLNQTDSSCFCQCMQGYQGDGQECKRPRSDENFVIAVSVTSGGVFCVLVLQVLVAGMYFMCRRGKKYKRLNNRVV